jgi:hypothetical protein
MDHAWGVDHRAGCFLGFVEPEHALTFALDTPDAYPVDTLTPVADGRAFVGRDARSVCHRRRLHAPGMSGAASRSGI